MQVQRGVPAGVELAVAGHLHLRGAGAELFQAVECADHLVFLAHDPDEVLHHLLQVLLHLERALRRGPVERCQRPLRRGVRLVGVNRTGGVLLRVLRGELAGALAQHEQVGERVPAEAVRPVDAGGALAAREQARYPRHLRVALDADAAHHVVRGRADLHRLLRDVQAAEFLELVVHARQFLLPVLGRVELLRALSEPLGERLQFEEHAAVRAAAALLHLAHDAPRDVVAGEQLRGSPRVLALVLGAEHILEAFFFVLGGLRAVVLRDVAEHEPRAGVVPQHAALAAHAFRDQNAANGRRPHHAGGVELHELHVDEFRARVVGERVPVAGVLPRVRRDLVRLADAAGRENDRLRAEHGPPAALAVVGERARDPVAVLQQPDDGALHVHRDALVDAVILERADEFEAGAVADVREPRVLVPAEVPLEDFAVGRAVEHRAPLFEFAHAVRGFARVKFGHAPVVDVLPAAHRIGEVDLPVVAGIDVGERRRDPAFGHHRVRLAEQRLAHQPDRYAGRAGFDGRAKARAAGPDNDDIVFVSLIVHEHSR